MQCNIDAKGKLVRLVYGIVLIVAAVLVAMVWARRSDSNWPWVLVAVLGLSGSFAIFESRKGWCAIRAMGFKTPI
jgi:hypothetical protein